MRILHTSDWHLGKTLLERPLLADQAHLLEQVSAELARERYDLFLVAGDVFDRSVPPESAVTLLGRWLSEVRALHPHLPIVFIAGNHDSAARLAWSSPLLALSGVHIRGDRASVDQPIAITTSAGERAEVWAIPFLWPESTDSGVQSQVEMLEGAVASIRTRQDPACTQIAVAHCFAQGGRGSDSERTLVGQATLIEPSTFQAFDYVALGHLHRPQAVAPHVWYSGSLAAYSFSEADDRKGLLSIRVQRGALPEVERVPLRPLHPLTALEGDLEDLLVSEAFEPYRDHYLSIRLHRPVLAGQPMARLRRRFPNLLQLLNPAVEVPIAEAPAAQTGEHHDLRDDFVAFYRYVHGANPDAAVDAAFEDLRREEAAV